MYVLLNTMLLYSNIRKRVLKVLYGTTPNTYLFLRYPKYYVHKNTYKIVALLLDVDNNN